MNVDEILRYLRTPSFLFLAGIAGALGYIMRRIDSEEKISKARVVVEFCSSAFVGLLVVWACRAMGLSFEWTGVTVGVSGWIGANAAIKALQKVVNFDRSKTP